jgi:hypothetical protein
MVDIATTSKEENLAMPTILMSVGVTVTHCKLWVICPPYPPTYALSLPLRLLYLRTF